MSHLVAVTVEEAPDDLVHLLTLLAVVHVLHEVKEESHVHLGLDVVNDEVEEVVDVRDCLLKGLALDDGLHGFLHQLHCHRRLLLVHLEGKLEGNVVD